MPTFWNFIKRYIYCSDIIGHEPTLKMGKEARNQTILGGLLCLLIYVLMFISFLYFGQELYYKIIPAVIESTLLTESADEFSISNKGFFFFIGLRGDAGEYIDSDGVMDITFKYITASRSKSNLNDQTTNEEITYSSQDILYEQCTRNHFGDTRKEETYSFLNYKLWKCIKENQNITIQGGESFTFSRYLQLQITKCQNNCKPENEVAKILSGTSLVIKYFDNVFDFRSFNDFSTSILEEELIYLLPSEPRKIIFNVMKVNFKTDIGYIFEDFSERYFLKKHFIREHQISNKPSSHLCTVQFAMSHLKIIYFRKYYKVQNLVAEMGGLAKAFLIIAIILNFFNDESYYYERMINQLFDVDDVNKYFQYHVPENISMQNQTRNKNFRDSVILRNVKNEKNYFEKGLEGVLRPSFDILTGTNKPNNFMEGPNNKRGGTGATKKKLKKKDINRANSSSGNEENSVGGQSAHAFKPALLEKETATLVAQVNNNSPIPEAIEEKPEKANVTEDDEDPHDIFIENMKKNTTLKEHFEKVKKNRFVLYPWELLKYCFFSYHDNPKYNTYIGGKDLIQTRSDIIFILRKNLEFDRFKNLMLRDYQLLLLNSLTKFMLDPERVNLIEFEHCQFDKMIDAYDNATQGNNILDMKLCKWVATKFKFDHVA